MLGLRFTRHLLLLPLVIQPASYRFSEKSPVSATAVPCHFLSPLDSLIHVFDTRFNHLVLGCPMCLLPLHINHTALLSIPVPSILCKCPVSSALFSIITHAWFQASTAIWLMPLLFLDVMWHMLTCITVFCSFTEQFRHNTYTQYGLQYAVDTLQNAAFVLQIKAEGKHTSLTWNWKQEMAMKQS